MAVTTFSLAVKKFYDTNGVTPLAGGKVYAFAAGTSNPLVTYSDAAGASANTHPIILDASGQASIYLLPDTSYDIVVHRSDNTPVGSPQRVKADNGDLNSVAGFGAVGDGTDETAEFVAATASGRPVYVPYTAAYYSVTSLTSAQLALLWGPGILRVAGVVTPISSSPTFASADIAGVTVVKPDLQPAKWPSVEGSIGNAAANLDVTRTGGFGTYGSLLNRLHVTTAVPAGQFDVGATTWCTSTNLTGGQLFGGWTGANTPSAGLGQTYSGGAVIGHEFNVGNRWGDFGLQTDIGGTRYTVGVQIVPDPLPAKDGVNTLSVSAITIASPGVVTVTAHGMPAWTGIVFNGSGTLPGGLTKGALYFVSSAGLTANTFQVAASIGGASINTTGSFAGSITITPSWAGSFATATSRSVWGHRWHVGNLLRLDSIMANGFANYSWGGSIAAMAPAAWLKLGGFWGFGIDFRGGAYASAPLNFDYTTHHSTTATAGSTPSPGNFQGFIDCIALNGGKIKIPYFNA
jgi:hypothetical protein